MKEFDYFNTQPKYQNWTKDDYEKSGIEYIEPMTAKALEDLDEQDKLLKDVNYIVEEKFDGTRGILHFCDDGTRVFSRRLSKKTGWLSENTDSVPQLRDINIPSLNGTIIDGEMFIPNRPFKDVSAIMNCLYDKAIERQQEIGWVVFHAFDIIKYRGTDVTQNPLIKRKDYLRKVIKTINEHFKTHYGQTCPFILSVPYFMSKGVTLNKKNLFESVPLNDSTEAKFPSLYEEMKSLSDSTVSSCIISRKAYFEYVVARGGEGVMIKPLNGLYHCGKRGKEYLKIKKLLTRDVIIMGFLPPTLEYSGKFPDPDQWTYWMGKNNGEKLTTEEPEDLFKISCNPSDYIPITKYSYKGWIGNIQYGVVITKAEIEKLPKEKKFNIQTMVLSDGKEHEVIEVGDCAGFDEVSRELFTDNQDNLIGTTMEVLANEQFSDTGKLRHPRFLRLRPDKNSVQCTWKEHF